MKKAIIITLLLMVMAVVYTANAHSGRTDSSGCHTDSRTGIYHCH